MALGKLTIVLGAGIIGSILTNDVSLPSIGDIFSGALKIVTKHGKQDKDTPSTSNTHTAHLLSQVNNLREELQLLASSRPVTIVTGVARSGSGAYRVTIVIVVGAIGYGYIWWKGWKLSDMMFVTKRGLSDACTAVGKRLEQVSASVTSAREHLSRRVDRVDCTLDECKELTEATREEVTVIHGDLSAFKEEMESVHSVVRNLETKLGRLEMSQDFTTRGVYDLCLFAKNFEQNRNTVVHQVSSSSPIPTIEPSNPVTRAVSLPLSLEEPSPIAARSSTTETPKLILRSSTTISTSGLKDLQGVSNDFCRSNSMKVGFSEPSNGASSSTEPSSSTTPSSTTTPSSSMTPSSSTTPTSSSSRFGVRLPLFGAFIRSSAS